MLKNGNVAGGREKRHRFGNMHYIPLRMERRDATVEGFYSSMLAFIFIARQLLTRYCCLKWVDELFLQQQQQPAPGATRQQFFV